MPGAVPVPTAAADTRVLGRARWEHALLAGPGSMELQPSPPLLGCWIQVLLWFFLLVCTVVNF